MKNNSNIIIALLAGLAAGAALGLLLAPEKGADTRDKLTESLQNLGDSIMQEATAVIERFTGLKNRIRNGNTKAGSEQRETDDLEHA